MLEMIALGLAGLLSAFMLRNRFYSIFLVILLTTEFYYIQVGSGVARAYHFLAVLVVILLARHIPRILSSRLFIALMVFVGINLCAIILSGAPERAMASFLAFCANVAVAMAVALILLTRRIELATFKKLILALTLISILWGLIQIVVFRFTGIALGLTPDQTAQVAAGFGPAFRSEANTFGKFMVLPFMLFLPEYIEYQRVRHINWIYIAFIIGIIMNFTRSSIYGMGITFLFIFIWYAQNNKLVLLTTRSIKIIVAIALCVILMISGILRVSEYAQHKLVNLFDQEEILEGGSSGYRMDMMRLILSDTMSDSKKIVIGNGWAQNQYYYHGSAVKAGGGDMVTLLGYAGGLGVAAYLLYMFMAAKSAAKASRASDQDLCSLAEGVLFALVGIFCTGQMAGYLITPEYWLLIGLALYISVQEQSHRALYPEGN